ncbi:MAG: hypothetical protein K8S54_01075 [Spirochaetia bacterium]|nr:hypothetical protein [Spirochaetia bacterium]
MPEKAAFRIAAHASDQSHGDLFIFLPGAESLITYELQMTDLQGLIAAFENRTDLEASIGKGSISLQRKADHRLLYWSFSGAISGDRGTLREVCRGLLIESPVSWPGTTWLEIFDIPGRR